MKLAIPTMGEGGLDSVRAGHFGHCDQFTVVEIEDGAMKGCTIVDNPPHVEGGCMRPVMLLSEAQIDGIVAAGMGMRPMMGFNQVGIDVYFDNTHPQVKDVVDLFIAGELPLMGAEHACNHHH